VGSGNQTPISVQAPVDTSGNQVTVVGQDNSNTSTGGSTTGSGTTSPPGTTPGGGATSPPSGGVSPPTGGSGAPQPGASVLPETGAASGLGGVALLGLLLVVAGTMILRRRETSV
jgi:LPXTG-motif cell wall-anchored protein